MWSWMFDRHLFLSQQHHWKLLLVVWDGELTTTRQGIHLGTINKSLFQWHKTSVIFSNRDPNSQTHLHLQFCSIASRSSDLDSQNQRLIIPLYWLIRTHLNILDLNAPQIYYLFMEKLALLLNSFHVILPRHSKSVLDHTITLLVRTDLFFWFPCSLYFKIIHLLKKTALLGSYYWVPGSFFLSIYLSFNLSVCLSGTVHLSTPTGFLMVAADQQGATLPDQH